MDKLKQWVALTALAAVAIAAGGWFLLISPARSEAAELTASAEEQESRNTALRNEIQVLKAQSKELPQQQAALAAVAAKIPDNPALPALIRALTAAGEASGAEFVALVPGAPTAATAVPAAGSTAASPTVAAAPSVDAAGASTTAAPALTGALVMPLEIKVSGTYFEIEQFVAELEQLTRALRVTGLNITPGESPTDTTDATVDDGSQLNGSISAEVFAAPTVPLPTAGAAAASPAAATAAAPSAAAPAASVPAAPAQ